LAVRILLSQLKASARVLPFQTSEHFNLRTWEKLFMHAPDTFERLYRDRRPAQKRST
jgi:hypothetical protein